MAQQTYNCWMHTLPALFRGGALHHICRALNQEPRFRPSKPIQAAPPPKVHAAHASAVWASAMCITAEWPDGCLQGLRSQVCSTLLSAPEAVHCPHSPS
jgi:hypothetical protein